MDVFVSGRDLNFDYELHSLVTSFSGEPEVNIFKSEESGAAGMESYVNHRPAPGISPADSLEVFYGDDTAVARLGDYSVNFPVDAADRKSTKNALKRAVYDVLSRHYKKELPWGTLSGVRPVKIPMKLMEGGADDKKIALNMRESYLVSDEKIRLALDVAKKEREILSRIDAAHGYSLYIGIPFCPTRCAYCSFTSYPAAEYEEKTDAYIDALVKELRSICDLMAGRTLQTIYIGGGTPTSLSAGRLERLMTAVDEIFDRSSVIEYTVESGRPDSITKEKLAVIKSHGAERISVNPQTMNQSTLDLIGRRHTAEQTKESFYLARSLGFSDINMDFILGLPGEGVEELSYSMEKALGMAPDNLTFHSLAVKRAGKIRSVIRDGAADDTEARLLYSEITKQHIDIAADTAKALGMEPYYLYRQQSMTGNFENTGYAVPGREGVYNIIMMEEVSPVMAAGAGAVSKLLVSCRAKDAHPSLKDIERVENVKNVDEYIARIDEMAARKARKVEEVYGT